MEDLLSKQAYRNRGIGGRFIATFGHAAFEWHGKNHSASQPQRNHTASDIKLKIIQRTYSGGFVWDAAERAMLVSVPQIQTQSRQRQAIHQDIHPARNHASPCT